MPRGFHRSRSFPAKRRKGWELGIGRESAQTPVTSSTSVLLADGLQILGDGFTLLRLRGVLDLFLSTTDQIVGGFSGAVGIGVTELNAFNAGVASLPDAVDDADWDGFIWWTPFSVKSVTATIGDAVNAGSIVQRFDIDTKAMRKLKEDDVIFAVLSCFEVGVSTLNIHIDSRLLLAIA